MSEVISPMEDKDLGSIRVEVSSRGLKNREFNLKTADLIKSQIGDIEQVRIGLGLSKRKICQLLLIDPSTWTRWTTGKTVPPPYVYRMLQWGLAVMDKYPEIHPLAQYEKFEHIKKFESLSNRIDKIEGNTENPTVNYNFSSGRKVLLLNIALFLLSLAFFFFGS